MNKESIPIKGWYVWGDYTSCEKGSSPAALNMLCRDNIGISTCSSTYYCLAQLVLDPKSHHLICVTVSIRMIFIVRRNGLGSIRLTYESIRSRIRVGTTFVFARSQHSA